MLNAIKMRVMHYNKHQSPNKNFFLVGTISNSTKYYSAHLYLNF